ncbi:Achelase-2, partial [Gryllus bimaculatus]
FADCRSGILLDGEVRGLPATVSTTTPFLASLEYKGKHICSAAAVAKRYAVTAARCVIGLNQEDLSLRSGTASSTTGGRKHQVEEIIVHPDYHPGTLDYDVAIIKYALLCLENTVFTHDFCVTLFGDSYCNIIGHHIKQEILLHHQHGQQQTPPEHRSNLWMATKDVASGSLGQARECPPSIKQNLRFFIWHRNR